jgi:hypothetical protein
MHKRDRPGFDLGMPCNAVGDGDGGHVNNLQNKGTKDEFHLQSCVVRIQPAVIRHQPAPFLCFYGYFSALIPRAASPGADA